MNLLDELENISRVGAYAATGNPEFLPTTPSPAAEALRAERDKAAQRRPSALFVEETIVAMRPELHEASDLVDALMAALKNRYRAEFEDDVIPAFASVEYAAAAFKKTIEKADRARGRE